MQSLISFAHSRLSWGILALSALALESAALYFQHIMKLDPCVMCIYQRVAVFGLLAAGLIGLVAPANRLVRTIGALLWGISAAWGLKLALELVDMQNNPNPFSTCSFLPEFPTWLQLHEWLPSVFMPTGMCSDIPWQFAGVTMGEWMIVAFAVYLLAWAAFIVPVLKKSA
ncbi:disulfide bond formation protein DsbB [Shewanella litorisediminis]|uniref:Disulfide bond formation protein B n=1 Tax=Shewanella litorisediminis TaxID=1173586 RepID=A0ABX7FYV8_9GAMM|nr:disulfide bond formation protein DsbB [Shewanella litorisediminis]MCL2918816.1 disulfide bond formation protein DsbB [Shewanella litorisediminis]QRH00216.1 disulfide bond formation protein DsbB [Shewanella litorisediminis]